MMLPTPLGTRNATRTTTVVLVAFMSAVVFMLPMQIIQAQGIGEAINGFFYNVAIAAGGFFVIIGGWALEQSLQVLVFQMGALMAGDSGIGVSVNTVWVVVRDGFNLMFIFGLIYIGLKLIWDAEDSGAKRALTSLIIAALLINFSLFIAKFIVDFSNIAALQIYDLMSTTLVVNTADGTAGFEGSDIGVSGYIMHLVGLQTIAVIGASGFGLSLAIFIFLLFTGLVLLAGSLMLITRFVMLCFYMIFAPVMFLGLILPKLKHHQDKWWNNFLKQAFFAPAYLFCLYIALRILAGARTSVGGEQTVGENLAAVGGQTGYIPPTGGGFEAVLFLILSLGFMLASIIVASRMSIHGADTSMAVIKGTASRMRRGAGNATSGVAARMGRTTVGAGANKLANSDWVNRNAVRFRAIGGRKVHNALKATADNSFDVRQVKVGGKSIGSQMDIGEGKKGGFVTRQKEDKKLHDEYLKSLKERDVEALEKSGELEGEMQRVSPKYVEAQNHHTNAKNEVTVKEEALKQTEQEVVPKIEMQKEAKKTATEFERTSVELFTQYKASADTEATKAQQRLTEAQSNPAVDPEVLKQATADAQTAEDNRKIANDKLQQANAVLAAKEKPYNDNIQALNAQLHQAKQELDTAKINEVATGTELKKEKNLAKANVKYENQMNYIKSLENSAERWDNAVSKVANFSGGTGALGGGVAGQTTLGVASGAALGAASGAAIGAGIAAGLTKGTAYAQAEMAKQLRKDWGASGEKKMKEKEDEKQLSAVMRKLSEQSKLMNWDGKPAKKEKQDDEDEDEKEKDT